MSREWGGDEGRINLPLFLVQRRAGMGGTINGVLPSYLDVQDLHNRKDLTTMDM